MTTSVPSKKSPHVRLLPTTPFGRLAIVLAGAGIALTFAWQLMPLAAWPGFIVQLAGGVFALIAAIRDGDRAISVFLAVLPMLFVVWFLAVEVLSLVGVLPEH